MKIRIKNIVSPLVGILSLLSVFLIAGYVNAETSARKKARYYYSAAIQEQAQGHESAAYEYFKRAHRVDPTYEEASSSYGTRRLYIAIDTLQSETELNNSLGLMRQYVDAYPDDIYESLYYGYVAGQLDNMEEATRVLERAATRDPKSGNILLQLSDTYARSGDLKKAVEAIDRFERVDGLSPQTTMRKLSYLLAESDTVGAIREVSRLVDSSPRNSSFLIIKGNVFDIIEKPDSAFKYYSRAEQVDPESGAAKLALAQYYQSVGDSVAYDNKLYEVLLTDDLDIEQKTELLAEYLQKLVSDKGDKKRGDYLFSVLDSRYPHEPRLMDLAARYSAAKGLYREAEEHISYALDQDPTNETYWGQLITYQALGDEPDKALETFDRAATHIKPGLELQLYAASVAQMNDKYGRAAEIYRNAISEIDPGLRTDTVITLKSVRKDISLHDLDELSQLLTSLGDVYNSDGRHEEAYLCYDNALELDPTNHMAMNNYAYFLSQNGGDLDKAASLSAQAITGQDAENPTYLDTFAWICFLKGDVAKAEEVQLKAVKVMEENDAQSPEIYDHLGDILMKSGDHAGAVENWKKAVKLQEENKETDEESYPATLRKIKETENKK